MSFIPTALLLPPLGKLMAETGVTEGKLVDVGSRVTCEGDMGSSPISWFSHAVDVEGELG